VAFRDLPPQMLLAVEIMEEATLGQPRRFLARATFFSRSYRAIPAPVLFEQSAEAPALSSGRIHSARFPISYGFDTSTVSASRRNRWCIQASRPVADFASQP
jgi:hypothetical protein